MARWGAMARWGGGAARCVWGVRGAAFQTLVCSILHPWASAMPTVTNSGALRALACGMPWLRGHLRCPGSAGICDAHGYRQRRPPGADRAARLSGESVRPRRHHVRTSRSRFSPEGTCHPQDSVRCLLLLWSLIMRPHLPPRHLSEQGTFCIHHNCFIIVTRIRDG